MGDIDRGVVSIYMPIECCRYVDAWVGGCKRCRGVCADKKSTKAGLYHPCVRNTDKCDDGVHNRGGIVTKAVGGKGSGDF